MNIDPDQIIAQEFEWVINEEPTFQISGNSLVGKVGKTKNGEDIRIKIVLPEFYPVVKPKVQILNNIQHPNIEPDKSLALQILDEWDPNYRLKHVIATARRLFIRSKGSIIEKTQVKSTQPQQISSLEQEVQNLQQEITSYNSKITELKTKQLKEAGVSSMATGAIAISKEDENKAKKLAHDDLLYLLQVKFEEAEIDQIDFFRLYRKYIKELYLVKKELNQLGSEQNDISKKKTERPIES